MAQRRDGIKMDSRSSRRALPAGVRHQERLADGRYLTYRRPTSGGAGIWSAREVKPGGKDRLQRIGTADDQANVKANGKTIFDHGQAKDAAAALFKIWGEQAKRRSEGEPVAEGGFTVSEALAEYHADGRRKGLKGMAISEQVAKARIAPELGAVPVQQLTRRRLEVWLDALAASPRRRTGQKVSVAVEEWVEDPSEDQLRARKSTANRILAILKRALNLSYELGLVEGATPWRDVKPFKGVLKARTRFLSAQEQVRLVNACPEDFQRLVKGALLSGARYGELTQLQVQDFHPRVGTVFIPAHVSKSGKSRHVILTDEGKAFFTKLCIGRPAGELMFLRDEVERVSRDMGNGWASSDQVFFMRRACKRAKLGACTFHELRHSYASVLVNKGVPLAFVAAQLGHADTRMVERHYGHLAPSAMAESIRKNVPNLGLEKQARVKPLKLKKA